MQGPTHKIISPIFTAGASTVYLRYMDPNMPLTTLCATVGVATIFGYISACWPDADQHAKYKPLPVIWAGFTPTTDVILRARGVKKVKARDAQGRIKRSGKPKYLYRGVQYDGVRHVGSRIWASIFRILGLREHRGFVSHSPLLWIPVWYFIHLCVCSIPYIGTFLSPVVLGMGLGFIGHILADAFTTNGVPLLPSLFGIVDKIPVVNHFTEVGVVKGRFFRASNDIWNKIVIIIFLDVTITLIFPEFGIEFNKFLLDTVLAGLQFAWESVKALFK